MPSHHAGEDAWCRFFFNCSVRLKYELIENQERGGKCFVTAQVKHVSVTLTLEDTMFLPRHSTERLNAHEDGHLRINERVYREGAEAAARTAAKTMMSQTWRGSGVDEDSAGKDATDKAVKALCDQYLRATADRALRIGQTYDELTNHGKRMRPTEGEAIEKAFAKESGDAGDTAGRLARDQRHDAASSGAPLSSG
jgi:hypothetical protein